MQQSRINKSNDISSNKGYSNYEETQVDEDEEVLPANLSGDENMERSTFPTYIKRPVTVKTNFFQTVVTIMKTVIGPGVLSLPYTISKFGYIFAIILFVTVMILSYFSTTLLIKVKNLTKHSNFSTIFYHLHKKKIIKGFGPLIVVLRNVGICKYKSDLGTVQLTIFKDAVRKILEDCEINEEILDQWYTSKIFIVVVIAALEFPLAAARRFAKLKMVESMALFCMAFFAACELTHFYLQMDQRGWQVASTVTAFPHHWLKFSTVMPNVILSLTIQPNFFPIYKGMRRSNDHRITSAAMTAILCCGSMYLIIGLFTYLLYGSALKANFLLVLDKKDIQPFLYYGMNAGFLTYIVLAFPIVFFSARNNFIALVKLVRAYHRQKHPQKCQPLLLSGQKKDDVDDDGLGSDEQYPMKQQSQITEVIEFHTPAQVQAKKRNQAILFYSLTSLLYLLIVTFSILAHSIELFFNLIGSLCSATMCFLVPYYFYARIIEKMGLKKRWTYYYTKVAFFVILSYAVFAMVVKHL